MHQVPSKVIIKDQNNLKNLIKEVSKNGIDNFHVVADFDRTFTKAYVNGKLIPSAIALLREGSYLDPEYNKVAHELFDTYHPIEISNELSREYRNEKMVEWWTRHFELLVKYGLTKQILDDVVKSRALKFREGVMEFIDILHENNIPLVIMSAGLGDLIIGYLQQEGRLYDNVYIVSNLYVFDSNGKVIDIRKPIIHSLNKHEVAIKSFPFYKEIENRKNVLLLGDNLDDVGMVGGFKYENLIKIGFLNEDVENREEVFSEVYDVVVKNDGEFEYVNEILKEIIK